MSLTDMIINIQLLAFLGLGAFLDLKRRTIPIWLIAAGIAAGIISKIVIRDVGIIAVLLSIMPGGFLLLFSFLTKEKVGYGDGWMVTGTGIYLGLLNNVILLAVALVMITLYQLIMILIKRSAGKTQVPFVPFILISFVLLLAIG